MPDRSYSMLDAMSYTYAAFSVLTDADHDIDEKREIFRITKEWAPDASDDEIIKQIQSAVEWVVNDLKEKPDAEEVFRHLVFCVDVLSKKFSKENINAFLGDLERIGKADGEYSQEEKDMIAAIKKIMTN
jgi:hypothetical protein